MNEKQCPNCHVILSKTGDFYYCPKYLDLFMVCWKCKTCGFKTLERPKIVPIKGVLCPKCNNLMKKIEQIEDEK